MNGAPPLSCSRTRVIVVVAVVARNLGSLKVGIESSPIIISDSLQKCCSPFIAHDVKIFPFALTMSKTLSKITSTYTYSPRPCKRHINHIKTSYFFFRIRGCLHPLTIFACLLAWLFPISRFRVESSNHFVHADGADGVYLLTR